MQVAIMGAGAVGCYFGGLLARAGHAVTFVGRPQHAAVINAEGLLFESRAFTGRIPAKAVTDPAAVEPPDLVLFCVKSADTETAGRALAPRLRPDSVILSLQNGVDNAARLQGAIHHPVLAAVVYVGTEMAGPGHVRHHGRGELLIGAAPASAALAQTLSAAGIPTAVAADIDAALWAKLILNCAYNALSAVAGISYGAMLKVPGSRDVIADVVGECRAVALASRVAVPGDMLDTTLALAATMPDQMSSTAQDLARGKPSEIDFLNGYVVRRGAELGIATPANRALQVMVKLAEASRAARN